METNSSGEENQTETLVMSSLSSQLFTDLSLLTTALIVPYVDDGATGTGLINSFVMIQDSPEEEGYNSDYRGTGGDNTQFDETNTLQFNHAITLASIPVVTKDGQQYLVLHLDLNERNSKTGPLIDLQTLKIFASDRPDLTGYDDAVSTFSSGASTLLYDMDSAGDVTARLEDASSGSGKGDYTFYIPVDGINGLPGFTNTSSGAFIYVYSKFGDPDRSGDGVTDGGFEEWFVLRQEGAHIDLAKTATIIDDTDTPDVIDNADESIRYVITITNTGSVDLTQLAIDDTMGGTWVLDQALLADATDDLHITQAGEGNHGDAILAPGEVWQITYIYDVTEDDLLSDQIVNTATVTTEQGAGDDATATVEVVAPPPMPAITLTKITGDGDGPLEDGDGLQLLAGSAITWTYLVENTGNTDLQLDKENGLSDDHGSADTVDDFNPVYVSGDANNDGVLNAGETWTFEADGKAVYGAYANTATVTAYFGDVEVTDTDDSSYVGTFEQAMAGRTQGFWGSRPGIWDGSTANNASFEKFVGTVLSAAEINPGQGYVLLGDLNGDGQTSAGENTIMVSNGVASALLSSKVSGDARVSMLQQAIAAQLNIYNGVINPGDSPDAAVGYQSLAGDLITETTLWLKTWGGGTKSGSASNLFADGVLNASDYNISKASLTDVQSAAQRALFWNTSVDVDSTDRNIHATGEDLKNLLDAFNNNKLITSAEGQVAWNDNDVSPETIVEPVGVEMNVADSFWAVGHDYISDFKGLVWHG